MFGWSNLAPITAINGAAFLRSLDAPPALLLPLLTTASAWLDFLIASGSAKWTAMAPVAVPMLMLLDISPEMATAAYRVGDTVTNLISPLNPYFVLVLIYCQRWNPQDAARHAAFGDAAVRDRVLFRRHRDHRELGGVRLAARARGDGRLHPATTWLRTRPRTHRARRAFLAARDGAAYAVPSVTNRAGKACAP